MPDQYFTEEQLDRMERDPEHAPVAELIVAVREQQRTLDRLRMSLDVALRDRDELRSELLACREEVRRLRSG
ncbi:MAG TPA: hypothetical protein VF167_06010 [Longimicrobiaceae bacterium]